MNPSELTLYTYLIQYALACPEKKLLGSPAGWLNVRQTLEAVESIAWELNRLGVGAGDLVALRTFRTVESALTMLALQAVGAVGVLTDPRKEPLEYLKSCAVEIPVKAVVDGGVFTDCATGAQTPLDVFALPRESWADQHLSAKEPGFIIFTSGSTGKSKPVMLSQYNLVNNLVDSEPLGAYSQSDIALGALPMDHVFGLVLLAGTVVLRYAMYLPESTELHTVLSAIEREGITRMNGVPSLYLAMAEQGDRYDLSTLRAGFLGAAPSTPEQFHQMEQALGMTLISVYGMSECIGIACASSQDPWQVRATGVGPFYSMNTGKILKNDGSEAAPGEIGEICVRGPARMVGYYPERMDEATFLHTGDLGYVDAQGVLHISGRKKDIIIRNGNNLSPRKIEETMLAIPGVEAAVVVGIPNPKQGEVPCAMAVSTLAELELIALLSGRLAKNEIPVGIQIVEEIPMTASGKPDKQHIREVLSQWMNR